MKKTVQGKTQQEQAPLLRKARAKLKKTNAEFAESLGVSEATMLAWLAPTTSGKHRNMPRRSRLLLAAILANAKRKERK
jgi:hypothetical protein